MAVPLLDLHAQYGDLREELRRGVLSVLDSQHFILGANGAELERRVAQRAGCDFGVALASGSDALILALMALGIGPGDEVVTTPFSFFATAGSITRAGARPVFADILPDSLNLDPEKAAERVTPRTRAILPVHLFGLASPIEKIVSLAGSRGLAVIEDCAQSIGAERAGRPTGSFGDAGCFSFYPTKNLGGAGDGGMLVTRRREVAERARLLRDHGQSRKYYHEVVGLNSRLDEIQAAILLAKLGRLDAWNTRRAEHAAEYDKAFSDLPVQTPSRPEGSRHVYHLYTLQTDRRDALAEHLKAAGIGCAVYYPVPLHLQPCYRSLGYREGDFPVAEAACRRVLSLPMFAELTAEQRQEVITAVRGFFGKR